MPYAANRKTLSIADKQVREYEGHGLCIMKVTFLLIVVAIATILSIAACSEDAPSTYRIARKGVLITEENFDVIHVYGFIDNREIARQITDFLNRSEPNTYHYYEVKD